MYNAENCLTTALIRHCNFYFHAAKQKSRTLAKALTLTVMKNDQSLASNFTRTTFFFANIINSAKAINVFDGRHT